MLLRTLLVDQIAVLKDLSARTVELYGETLDRLRDHLGHEATVDDLSDLTIARFLRWRAQQPNKRRGLLSPASVAKDSAHIRTIWNWCAKKRMKRSDGELLEFPDYARPKVPKPRPVAFTVEDLQRLLNAARHRKGVVAGVPAAWVWTTMVMAMFQTGERIGAVLMAPQRRAADALVWPWLEGRHFGSAYASLRVLCKTAGVDYHPFHSIRKATASYMKRAGKSARTQLGHSSEEMAETHYYDSRIVGAESALDYLPPLDLGGGPGKPR